MLEPKEVVVNGRNYIVNPFNPSQAHSFLHALIVGRGTGMNIAGLGRTTLSQCLTPAPEMKPLSDDAVFGQWFNEHPADMLALESAALDALTEPWEAPNASTPKKADV